MNEKDKQAFTRLIEKRNSEKEAEKVKKSKHIAAILKLDTLETKIEYWKEHFPRDSFLVPLGQNGRVLNIQKEISNRSERMLILIAEIERLDKTKEDFISTRIRRDFESRVSETNDVELTKSKFIERIDNHTGALKLTNLYDAHKEKGFNAYLGGRSIESKIKDLNLLSIGIQNQRMFRYTYEGYLLAELQAEIRNYPKSYEDKEIEDTRNQTLDPNSSGGKRHPPSLSRTELAMLGFALREKKIIAGIDNLTSKNLSFGLHELTGYSQKQFYKDLKGKTSIKDFQNNEMQDLDFIGKLKKFVHELEEEIKSK